MDGDVVAAGNLTEIAKVAGDESRFGDDADGETALLGEDGKNALRDAQSALDWLVGVGGCADGDLLAGTDLAQLLPEEPGGVVLGEDFALEVGRIAELHELVGVARIAVAAGKLAAAVGVDGPGETESAARGDAVQQ